MTLELADFDHSVYLRNTSGNEVSGMTKKALAVARPRFAIGPQIKALAGFGYDQIFEDFADVLAHSRKGEQIGCIDLRAFGSSHKQIAAELMQLHDKGCMAVHAATGRNSMQHGPALFSEALIAIHNERRTLEIGARKIGQMGQQASVDVRNEGKRPVDDCAAIWHNTKRYRSVREAVEAINEGYEPRSKTWLYDEFGER